MDNEGVDDSVRSDHPHDYYRDVNDMDDDEDDDGYVDSYIDDDEGDERDDGDDDDGSCRSSIALSLSARSNPRGGGSYDDDDDDRGGEGGGGGGGYDRRSDFHRKTSSLTAGVADDDDDEEHDGSGGNGSGESTRISDRDECDYDDVNDGEYYDDDDDDDDDDDVDDDVSLGFPPGHITSLDELNDLQNAPGGIGRTLHRDPTKLGVNPSVIPSYFFCPLTRMIMIDPVMTPRGHTYERRAILRHLILEDIDPMSGTHLTHEGLVDDRLVRKAIDKARKESWARYLDELPVEDRGGGRRGGGYDFRGDCMAGDGDNGDNYVEDYDDDDADDHDDDDEDYDDDDDDRSDDVVDRIIVVDTDRERGDGEVGDMKDRGGNSSITLMSDGENSNGEYDHRRELISRVKILDGGKRGVEEMIINDRLLSTLTPTPKTRGSAIVRSHNVDVVSDDCVDRNIDSIPAPPLLSSTPSSTPTSSIANQGATPILSSSPMRNNHGWSVPLGVHRITCAPPGLVVTVDVHRRSNVVKRKIIRKSLVHQEVGGDDAAKVVTASSKLKTTMKRNRRKNAGGGGGDNENIKIVTDVITRDLVLPPGSYVEVMETRVHGGRVRGRIVWEEEVMTEIDRDVMLHLEEMEVRARAEARPEKPRRHTPPGRRSRGGKAMTKGGRAMTKAMASFRRKTIVGSEGLFASEVLDQPMPHYQSHTKAKTVFRRTTIESAGSEGLLASELLDQPMPNHQSPAKAKAVFRRMMSAGSGRLFESELLDQPMPNHHPSASSIGGGRGRERQPTLDSTSHLTTIKYGGWISLQWAGGVDNHERDEAIGRRKILSVDAGGSGASVETALNPATVDEDEGPWSESLPLGVYRIGNADDGRDVVGGSSSTSCVGHLSLNDAPDDESNAIDFLVPDQCIEVLETQVLVMKKTRNRANSGAENVRRRPMGMTNTPPIDSVVEQVVRARCMVPVIVPPNSQGGFGGKPQKKFKFGWITLDGRELGGMGSKSLSAYPIPQGAYIVMAEDPLVNRATANSKSILSVGSVSDLCT